MSSYLEKLGEVIRFEDHLIFFGGKKAVLSDMNTHLPQKELCLLKQTHGDVLQLAQASPVLEGDAHWTSDQNKILLIQTADCLPIMIMSPQKNVMMAIHAGWKGVAQKITEKSLLSQSLNKDTQLRIWIGPHIQQESFEVDKDVAEHILSAHSLSLSDVDYVDKRENKYHISLEKIVRRSLVLLGVNPDHIAVSPVNTRESSDYYSFRRGERGGRNYSFITHC